ncbi:Rho1 guanine nucleotide exchange factor 1 [Aulographum hederae CBS 113979]|uniref:Rho1 guanine nucleotide exchange factor 1 n=1 Tax=Aulographum hederae CBS 113979 TaxID=1176131 RepID=A0A6G1GWW3_9PEZI|nr:Rho1 guanine nucleotide exchange factor 1 [Aulographum hederae CBS 113979]
MAEYGTQQGREYGRNYGHASPFQRDAAFNHIFGTAPPGRAQTMAAHSLPPESADRAQTMSSQSSDFIQQRPPPVRQHMNGTPQPVNGAMQGQRHDGPPMPTPQRQPNPQYLPQPIRQDRAPFAQPPRINAPQGPHGPHGQHPQYPKPPGQRFASNPRPPPGHAGPAMQPDQFRSQSMAAGPRPQFHPGANGSYNISPAHSFRQQPYMNHPSRTTAQGRVVPERPDERTMSMTSHGRDGDHNQTMSGRIIPSRRREPSNEPQGYEVPSPSQMSNSVSPVSPDTIRTRRPSQSSLPSRTMSIASNAATNDRANTMNSALVKSNSQSTHTPLIAVQRRTPLVYPALLSRVADVFRDRIGLAEKTKDGLDYKSAFSGAEAVDIIAYVIKTTDRNLALLLGRSLDAQKFFHDVTYAHRLRDSQGEIYQFRDPMVEGQPEHEVNGVFTLLTECYSPTCTRERLCYSIACPRRLEQQARLNMKLQPGLKREESRSSLHEEKNDEQKLWINTVSKEVAESVSSQEKKRQEVISELMYTERDFVKDLEYLRDFWMKPLRQKETSPIPEQRREKFVRTVFSNCQEVYMVSSRLADALTRRQQQNPVVRNVADIFLEYVPKFSPFISYGKNQLFGKYEFENEKRANPQFQRFVDEVERMKESRKLELNGYLTKPTTRLARYPLLLEAILKQTSDDNPDKQQIPLVIAQIKETLSKVNTESGKAENHFNLMQLNRELSWQGTEYVDLRLTDEVRQLIYKGTLKKTATEVNPDVTVYLFDHAVLLVRTKVVAKKEVHKVYRKPIPLELLVLPQMEELAPRMGIQKRPSSGLMGSRAASVSTPKTDSAKQPGYPLTFRHLGKGGYELTLYCVTPIQQQKWLEHVEEQQRKVRDRTDIFTQSFLNRGFFAQNVRVNCCVPIDGGRKLVLGTDYGVYVCERKPKDASMKPKRVLDCKSVTQIDVLEQHQILLVLSEKTLYSYSVDALTANDNQASTRGRKICSANFFKAGVCQGQQLVCCVKTSALSTTIKVYEPMDSMANKKLKKTGLGKLMLGTQDVLKPLKEFYIPTESTSIHFLRSKLCVGCARGFEVVSLETLETQTLLDQADTSLDFVQRKENIKPIHIERIATEFLLCYTDYSFFVNRNGWRARPDWMIEWEGTPQAFAIFNPYILAFEPSFIEIRHMDTGNLIHIETAKNVRMLHSSSREILYAYEDEMGEDVIASLDFWSRPQSPPQGQGHIHIQPRPHHPQTENGPAR